MAVTSAPLAQWTEQRRPKPLVPGSTPGGGANVSHLPLTPLLRLVAMPNRRRGVFVSAWTSAELSKIARIETSSVKQPNSCIYCWTICLLCHIASLARNEPRFNDSMSNGNGTRQGVKNEYPAGSTAPNRDAESF